MQLSQSRLQREASIKRSPQIGIKLAGYISSIIQITSYARSKSIFSTQFQLR